MYPNISAFDKSNEKESLNNIQSNKRFSIVSIRLAVPGFKQEHLTIHENQVVARLPLALIAGEEQNTYIVIISVIFRVLKALT